jgi:hypothetical protein
VHGDPEEQASPLGGVAAFHISLAPSMVDIPMKNDLYAEEAEYDPSLVGPASAR